MPVLSSYGLYRSIVLLGWIQVSGDVGGRG